MKGRFAGYSFHEAHFRVMCPWIYNCTVLDWLYTVVIGSIGCLPWSVDIDDEVTLKSQSRHCGVMCPCTYSSTGKLWQELLSERFCRDVPVSHL